LDLVSKKEYRGINHLITTVVSMSEGFSSPNWWVTFWQIKVAGRDLWRFMPHFSAGALWLANTVGVAYFCDSGAALYCLPLPETVSPMAAHAAALENQGSGRTALATSDVPHLR
jgi:hypothetical protein